MTSRLLLNGVSSLGCLRCFLAPLLTLVVAAVVAFAALLMLPLIYFAEWTQRPNWSRFDED